jgi:hypothetical protein
MAKTCIKKKKHLPYDLPSNYYLDRNIHVGFDEFITNMSESFTDLPPHRRNAYFRKSNPAYTMTQISLPFTFFCFTIFAISIDCNNCTISSNLSDSLTKFSLSLYQVKIRFIFTIYIKKLHIN